MSGRRVALPQLPVAPTQYDQRFMAEVVRSFSVLVAQLQNPGELRGTALTLTELQENDYQLETGALFQQDGVVKIALLHKPHPAGVFATGSVGTVSVITT